MHQREVLAAGGGTLTDTLHLVWAAITRIFMLIVGFGAVALGRRFRIYSIATTLLRAPNFTGGLRATRRAHA